MQRDVESMVWEPQARREGTGVDEGRFHHERIRDYGAIRSLLERLSRERIEVRLRVNREMRLETGTVERLAGEEFVLNVKEFESDERSTVYVNFDLDGAPYFFAAVRLDDGRRKELRLQVPGCVYRSERRERVRRSRNIGERGPDRVVLVRDERAIGEGVVSDYSPVGLGVNVWADAARDLDSQFQLHFVDGPWAGQQRWARVRHRSGPGDDGWARLGLAVTAVSPSMPISSERRDQILGGSKLTRLQREASFIQAGIRLASRRSFGRLHRRKRRHASSSSSTVEYKNEHGERLRALIDTTGCDGNPIGVIIPPAWGRTKETLSPLAAVLNETFRRAEIPAVIVRFDGIRRRGESHNDPECYQPGREQLNYTLSQGVSDISATLSFLENCPEFRVTSSVLVTFSAAALDGRKAVAQDEYGRLEGWVSVVGMPELQHCMKVISGGVDYPVAVEHGMRLGSEEILGVPIDVDRIVGDAVENGFAYLEDARRDMADISVPITWIHGRYDAWMDVEKVREILGCGDTANRRLLEVPTGHQLSTSREALEVFQLIAAEAGRMLLGRSTRPVLPPLTTIWDRQREERARIRRRAGDLRGFWRDFLLGRDRSIGIDWLGATSAYRKLMEDQIDYLRIADRSRVLDMGAGTGAFASQLAAEGRGLRHVAVDSLDFVHEGLQRAQRRLGSEAPREERVYARFVTATLEMGSCALPFKSESYDRVLASLVLGYVSHPEELLSEVLRILRPRGRLVLSVLKRDADLSKLYVDAMAELRAGRAREVFGEDSEELVLRSAPQFLNEASRLHDFEEMGRFRFWDHEDLHAIVEAAGFQEIEAGAALGVPPQAILMCAAKPG